MSFRCKRSVEEIDWKKYFSSLPFNKSALALYEWAPIAEELKTLDICDVNLYKEPFFWSAVACRYGGKAPRHCGLQPGMAKPRFKCLAGGLDVAAKTLDELQEKEAPPEDPPTQNPGEVDGEREAQPSLSQARAIR